MVGLNIWMGRLQEVVRISTLSWWNKANIAEMLRCEKFKAAYIEWVSRLTVKQKETKNTL